MKKIATIMLAAIMALALCACAALNVPADETDPPAETTAPESSAEPETADQPADTDAPASDGSAEPTAEPDADVQAALTEAGTEAMDALRAILSDISDNYHTGTAGSSLTSARMAGQLLDWYAEFKPKATEIVTGVQTFLNSLSAEKAIEFVTEQVPDIYASVKEVIGETGRDLLESAGYTPTSFPWSEEDVQTMFSALFTGIGIELPND